MGIPSYFKHILDRYPRLLKTVATGATADVLLVDFNCLIYGCIRTVPFDAADPHAWEAAVIRAIETYVVHIWRAAGQPRQVLLAVDGVVPFAKMRQQRLRRFKSVWLAAKEREYGVREGPSWDTNAITPGTEFMERLAQALRRLASARPGWIVSAADEPGEGEQKCMAWARAQGPALSGKSVWVYGLDADLIILSLLHSVVGTTATANWSILRERMEFGSVKGAGTTEAEFLTLDVGGLAAILWPDAATRQSAAYSYVGGMSLLGNDFLPHSLGISIRSGGHDVLLEALQTSGPLVAEGPDGRLEPQKEALLNILRRWASTEEADIAEAFERKYKMRSTPRTDAEKAMIPVQNLPLEWAVEAAMWQPGSHQLYEGWRSTYYRSIGAMCQADIWQRCQLWCEGFRWILDYYTGQAPVSYTWVYPWSHPPLWSDLITYMESRDLPSAPIPSDPPLQPQEQLAIVLPLESWGLIRDAHLRALPQRLPTFWPKTFGFESLGKRWFWECEADLPLIHPHLLKYILAR